MVHITEFTGGQGLPAVIANGMTFGGADRLTIPATPSLDFKNGFTFSTWIRIAQPQQNATLLQRKAKGKESLDIQINGTQSCFQITDAAGKVHRTQTCLDLPLESWHHIAFAAASKSRMALYLDGEEMFAMSLPVDIPPLDGPVSIAAAADGSGGFTGDLDEIQLSNVSRPADWIRAAFASQGPQAALLSVAGTEMGGSSAFDEFIMTTVQVVRNISLDGWIIIGTLFLMGAASWIVFINKAYTLWLAGKENNAFTAAFAGMSDPLAEQEKANGYSNSNLYRVYEGGCQVFNRRDECNCAASDFEIKTFKAALEKAYIDESKRLNSWMLLLTMSITGGPFLGLLGTVWGVMSTFAAMAEAGEANIAAIAPGVASALATTVTGLIVAIPALFAYNYLLSRIKTISADLQVFIDQFTLKLERLRGGAA